MTSDDDDDDDNAGGSFDAGSSGVDDAAAAAAAAAAPAAATIPALATAIYSPAIATPATATPATATPAVAASGARRSHKAAPKPWVRDERAMRLGPPTDPARLAWEKNGAKLARVSHRTWQPSQAERAAFEALRNLRNSVVEHRYSALLYTVDSWAEIFRRHGPQAFCFCTKDMIANMVRHVATTIDRLEQCHKWGAESARDPRSQLIMAELQKHVAALL